MKNSARKSGQRTCRGCNPRCRTRRSPLDRAPVRRARCLCRLLVHALAPAARRQALARDAGRAQQARLLQAAGGRTRARGRCRGGRRAGGLVQFRAARRLSQTRAKPGLPSRKGDADDTWCIVCFFIRPDWRGQGLATALLRAATDAALAAGASEIEGFPALHREGHALAPSSPGPVSPKCSRPPAIARSKARRVAVSI